ncbi:unnamed protein product [Paramecium sonneborni]|uniref:SUN domain-containing protein n=1 Tax=Paramecium sonneborni TaxID=65129 RepID=A0A8S1NX53_9CILI|nr:unnamed protein product [Paramecium sonneborni]
MVIRNIQFRGINMLTYIDNWFENVLLFQPIKEIQKNLPSAQNFANKFGGAIILTKSNALQQIDNVLVDSVELYMITECDQKNVFFIVCLQEEISLEIITIINKELYSSTIKNFQVYGSVVYPTKEWELLGNFLAEDSNEWQIFNFDQRFLRYLKIHIIDFHTAEFHCTLTQIRVFGQTVIGDLIDSHKREKIIKPESKIVNSTQEKEEINLNEVSEEDDGSINDTCSVADYFYINQNDKRIESKYINVLPFESKQSLFKVTAQNILILSHNVELFKYEINQIKQQNQKDQKEQDEIKLSQSYLFQQISELKLINQKLVDELNQLQKNLFLSLFCIIAIAAVITIILLIHCFCNQDKQQQIMQQTRVGKKNSSAIVKSQPQLLNICGNENQITQKSKINQIQNQKGKQKKAN